MITTESKPFYTPEVQQTEQCIHQLAGVSAYLDSRLNTEVDANLFSAANYAEKALEALHAYAKEHSENEP